LGVIRYYFNVAEFNVKPLLDASREKLVKVTDEERPIDSVDKKETAAKMSSNTK